MTYSSTEYVVLHHNNFASNMILDDGVHSLTADDFRPVAYLPVPDSVTFGVWSAYQATQNIVDSWCLPHHGSDGHHDLIPLQSPWLHNGKALGLRSTAYGDIIATRDKAFVCGMVEMEEIKLPADLQDLVSSALKTGRVLSSRPDMKYPSMYVVTPVSGASQKYGILEASGIVAAACINRDSSNPLGDRLVKLCYEGNVHGDAILRDPMERITVAAGRLLCDAPTIATSVISTADFFNDFTIVGEMHLENGRIQPHKLNSSLLKEWMSQTAQLQESSQSEVDTTSLARSNEDIQHGR